MKAREESKELLDDEEKVLEESKAAEDYTKLPSLLDSAFDKLDPDHAVRPLIIKPATDWKRKKQVALAVSGGSAQEEVITEEKLNREKNAALDLLDALTRSGALPIENAALHIVIGASHSFGDSLMNSLVQRNVNPVEVLERSTLIMSSTLLDAPTHALVQSAQLQRLLEFSPQVVLAGGSHNLTSSLN